MKSQAKKKKNGKQEYQVKETQISKNLIKIIKRNEEVIIFFTVNLRMESFSNSKKMKKRF